MDDVKLGKLPAKSSPHALMLARFVAPPKTLPKATNFWTRRKPFPVRSFYNTSVGDCTRASQAILAMRMERLETKQTPKISDDEVLRVYYNMTTRLYGGGDTGAFETDALCYSDDTEVLTRRGWINFAAAVVGETGDEFATRNPETKAFEWQKATAFHESHYSGSMVRLHSRSLDLLVTPNHRVLVTARPRDVRFYGEAKKHGDEWLVDAKDLLRAGRRTRQAIPATSTWHCTAVSTWEAPRTVREEGGIGGSKAKPFSMQGDDWARFLGMYLSEGSVIREGGTHQHEVCIAQNKDSKGFQPFRALLSRIIGREPYYIGHQFVIPSVRLADYLRRFGKSYEKYIPSEIKEMPPRQLRLFWEFYVLGDGHIRANGRTHVVTASKRMADDLQEIIQKLGYSATIQVTTTKKDVTMRDGRVVLSSNSRPHYILAVRTTKAQTFTTSTQDYDGQVRCVTVPNHVLYVRRKGRPAWCGNSEWRRPDLTFRDYKGRPLTIEAFLAVNHTDQQAIKEAIFTAGAHGIKVCLNLPLAFQGVYPPRVWDLPEGQAPIGPWLPGSWGGHSMSCVDYNEFGLRLPHQWDIPDQWISWRAAAIYIDESFLVIDSVDNFRKRTGVPKKVAEAIKDAVNQVSDMKIK